MKRIVECVPNFSEGRDPSKVEEIAAAIASIAGVVVLDREMDANHHRSVITFAGEPESVVEAALRGARRAVELIDLTKHSGEHPRIGALDVLPFVPIRGVTMEECIALARVAGERIARELGVPVYLYEKAATRPDRINLADIRRGEFEALRKELGSVPDRVPDFGESRIHPTAGAMAVGARFPLIAYNVNLATTDISIAKKVAKAVRGRDGGLQHVKALGFELKDRGQVQVSMNLVNYEATPIFRAFEMVCREAKRHGVNVAASEIVGLVPQAALNACADFYLQLEGFSEQQVLERRLEEALRDKSPLGSFAEEVASGAPTPGGGSVAAYSGALAAALGAMVCNLTIGRKRFAEVEPEATQIRAELEQILNDLKRAVSEDAESFDRVLAARHLPKDKDADKLARDAAIEEATKGAVAVPLRVASISARMLELLDELAEIGNPNALSDLAVGAQLALTAIRGAAYNVLINLSALVDAEFRKLRRNEVEEMVARGQELADEIEDRFMKANV
jgi:glutamate formiminotransferase / formiminotetrahydrofolate cyclodeaminase